MKFTNLLFSVCFFFLSLSLASAQNSNSAIAQLDPTDETTTTNTTPQIEALPMYAVDQMPGSGVEGLDMASMIAEQLEYPSLARDYSIEGRVTLHCIIDAQGQVVDAKVVKSLGYGCDEAALAALHALAPWQAAQKDGKAVAVSCFIPVDFSLR